MKIYFSVLLDDYIFTTDVQTYWVIKGDLVNGDEIIDVPLNANHVYLKDKNAVEYICTVED